MARDIGSLRVNELRGTTGFRLALFFLAVFGSASLIFVGVVYLNTSRYLSGNPDERMRVEAAEMGHMPEGQRRELFARHGITDPTGRRPFGLFSDHGEWIAGNLPQLPRPLPERETFFETRVRTRREDTIYRSFLHTLPDGRLVVVSRNIEELQRFRNELLESTLLGLLLMLMLGGVGALIIARGSLRWLDSVTSAIEVITRGDLSGRLPRRDSDDELDRLVRVINTMLDQIERLMGEVKGVCDSIAHDLRTPLTRLLAVLERANRQTLSEDERRGEIAGAILEVRSMLRTFAALLRISEVEDGARRLSFCSVDLNAIAADAVDYYSPAAEEKNVRLSFDASSGAAGATTIEGDRDLLFEALGNLVDNAIKFTPEQGLIIVSVEPGPVVTIRDTGCGMAPEDHDRVKLRFQRGSRTQQEPGNGLGLPLVSAIARLHGLELRFDPTRSGCRVRLATSSSEPAQH